ncbi:SDR family NAD(P)-dependent oxidoreductase [Halioxenophilus aromaticivorans]|uniref:3-oxoacyl-[acyl-carrier-protein] reductase n=1 Tax=Halioxenophilus aromaticivorans TaxID=1306992 RepID=A0AAV3U6C4_9ALTE
MSKQVALVTGAAGGFGSAIGRSLHDVGYHVVLADISQQRLEALSEHLGASSRYTYMVMDVCDITQVQAVADTIQANVGENINVLVNNAGILEKNYCLQDTGPPAADKIFDVNLKGCFNCTSVLSRKMAKQRYGRIINIASIAGVWGASGGSAYAASKAGLIKASESWARELGPLNIVVTAVAPGICKTNMFGQFINVEKASASENASKLEKSMVPSGRFGTPEDIAEVVTFLATCKTTFINGTVIEMDGGMRVGQI